MSRHAELKERLEHLSLRKDELKQQLQDKEAELDDIRRVYRQVNSQMVYIDKNHRHLWSGRMLI